jgi:uncharacterized protein YdhG (YjbR/CyaY superfamily)
MANTNTKPYGTIKHTSIDAYHAQFDATVQKKLTQLRQLIAKAAPNATEVISYNMPAFKQHKVLVYYAAYKSHIGFYPTGKPIVVFAQEMLPYKTSKGAIQFELDKPLPVALIKKIVKFRIQEVEAKLFKK